MSGAPADQRRDEFVDYPIETFLLRFYVPPQLWPEVRVIQSEQIKVQRTDI